MVKQHFMIDLRGTSYFVVFSRSPNLLGRIESVSRWTAGLPSKKEYIEENLTYGERSSIQDLAAAMWDEYWTVNPMDGLGLGKGVKQIGAVKNLQWHRQNEFPG